MSASHADQSIKDRECFQNLNNIVFTYSFMSWSAINVNEVLRHDTSLAIIRLSLKLKAYKKIPTLC